MKENTYTPKKKKEKKANIVRRFKSAFKGRSGKLKYNTYMEYLVELPNGQRVWLTRKELKDFQDGEN